MDAQALTDLILQNKWWAVAAVVVGLIVQWVVSKQDRLARLGLFLETTHA